MMPSYLYGTCYLQSNAGIRPHKFRRLSRDLVMTDKSPPLDLVINIRQTFQSSDLLVTKYYSREFAFLLHIECGWMLFRRRRELTCRAEPLLGPIIYVQVSGDGDAVILQGQVGGLVALVVGAAQGHR